MAQMASEIVSFLSKQGMVVSPCTPESCYLNKNNDDAFTWPRLASFVPSKEKLKMSLSSMVAAEQLCPKPEETVLDVCAAPGMKSLYLSILEPEIVLYCNDVSRLRLERMRRLHKQYGVNATYSLMDASRVIYQNMQFDKVFVDAPCSGEGVALAGDAAMIKSWSISKVHRLQQLQYKILKQAWKALKPGGTLVYATCTLNRYENEIVIKKALKREVQCIESKISTSNLMILKDNQALRILPSKSSMGFFIAKIEKPIDASGSLLDEEYLID